MFFYKTGSLVDLCMCRQSVRARSLMLWRNRRSACCCASQFLVCLHVHFGMIFLLYFVLFVYIASVY